MSDPARVLAALALEAGLGYPAWLHRWAPHPVTWIGHALDGLERCWNRPAWPSMGRRLLGVATLVLVGGGVGVVGWTIDLLAQGRPWVALLALLIATTGLAQRSLYQGADSLTLTCLRLAV